MTVERPPPPPLATCCNVFGLKKNMHRSLGSQRFMINDLCFISNMIFSAPRILTGPDSVTNVTGDKVVLMCEATGFPIPHIGWLFQRTDDETNSLPGILYTLIN